MKLLHHGKWLGAMLTVLVCMSAHAATSITTVTNDYTATNGCTVISVAGYGGYDFQVSVFGVDCPDDPIVYPEKVERFYSWGGYSCEMRTYTQGYFVTSSCGSYTIYRQ